MKLRKAHKLGLVAAAVLNGTAGAYEYELQGKVEGTHHYVNDTPQELETIQFHAYVRDCSWLIRLTPEPGGFFSKRIRYWEIASEGKALYGFASLNPSDKAKDTWEASVSKVVVPLGSLLPQSPVAWLAIASACHLETDSMIPPYSMDFVRQPVHVHVVRREQSPRLAERIVFYFDGRSQGGEQSDKLPPSSDTELPTNAVYSALNFRKVGGLDLPAAFTLEVYRRSPYGLKTEYTYRGVVEEARAGCSLQDFLPRIPEGVEGEIKDLRFISADAHSLNPFDYRSKQWLSEVQVRQLPGFSHYVQWESTVKVLSGIGTGEPPDVRPKTKPRRTAVVALLIGSALTVTLLSWRTLRQKKQP